MMNEVEIMCQVIEKGGLSGFWRIFWYSAAPILLIVARLVYLRFYGLGDEPLLGFRMSFFGGKRHQNLAPQLLLKDEGVRQITPMVADLATHHIVAVSFTVPARVAKLMRYYDAPWCIAGGWALDLFLGEVTRTHQDIEVAVLRRDQEALADHLLGWHPCYVVPGKEGLKPWLPSMNLALPVHEVHVRPPQSDVAALEILLNEADGGNWVYRRDQRVTMPLSAAIQVTKDGIPYLAPEIVLLYKSTHRNHRDQRDFETTVDRLDFEQQQWLRDALQQASSKHPWLSELS